MGKTGGLPQMLPLHQEFTGDIFQKADIDCGHIIFLVTADNIVREAGENGDFL